MQKLVRKVHDITDLPKLFQTVSEEISRRIRQKEKSLNLKPIPIICISANAWTEYKKMGKEIGFIGFRIVRTI
jgi:hypothetical protein